MSYLQISYNFLLNTDDTFTRPQRPKRVTGAQAHFPLQGRVHHHETPLSAKAEIGAAELLARCQVESAVLRRIIPITDLSEV